MHQSDSALPSFQTFADLPLSQATLKAVKALGFEQLTPIQAQILPHTLAHQDAIGQAQTGTGKTATFLITIIEALLARPFKASEERFLGEPRALVLAPTRELAQQIFADCRELVRFADLHSVCVTGGADFDKQAAQLSKRPLDILIGTPGRIIDWVQRGELFLDRVEVFVLDEADRMLDMGFIPDIKRIVRHMPANTDRQSLLFSATFNQDVMNLAYRWLHHPAFVEIAPESKTNKDIEQRFYLLTEREKMSALRQILSQDDVKKAIVFANRKDQVKRLYDNLRRHHDITMLSGDVAQQKRERYLQRFKDGEVSVLVATDVAGRGIHVDDVTHVINFTLPDLPDDYVHRIGRTGRAGHTGTSISFVSENDAFNVPDLERHVEMKFKLEPFIFVQKDDTPKDGALSSANSQTNPQESA
ncbi:ATP-dependent RNA helicase rhlB [Moraxella caviae]|uniref:ATP-dependent RNA helicase RhlB n=1 Tax=Moraxella caviae TaxID=34060 RepID=A0A378R8Q2_9GAMM|nr:ATP-dependent RNA helicase rhlB [Moraxella caviae]VEW10518.1 ATP-dependent RNA helicase rhlB [Moraxella caviae]